MPDLDSQFYRLLADTSYYAEIVGDEAGTILCASPSCTTILGHEPQRIMEEPGLLKDMIHPDCQSTWQIHMDILKTPNACHSALLRINLPGKHPVWIERQAQVITGPDGELLIRSSCRRVCPGESETISSCELKEGSLTGLPGREYCMLQLERLFESSRRSGEQGYGVIYADIDQLKRVNDSMGHSYGDLLIRQAAERLHEHLPPMGDLMHLGGDEFIIIIDNTTPRAVIRFVKEIQDAFKKPCILFDQRVTVAISMGIVLSPVSYVRPEDLLRNANIAMRKAKTSRHGYKVFHARLLEESLRSTEIELDLPRALTDGEFYLHYQPIISLESHVLTGFEALLRWDHPKWGVIRPDEFLPIAESTDFIVPLGEWILKRAMRDMQQLHTKRPDFAGLSVAVNISAKQLNRYDFVNQVQKALSDTGYDPELLKLEITETAAMTNPELTDTRLGKLKKMGIEISLDDFGTGYSSLSYLRTLPVDCLKVDRSFVSGMDQSQEKQQIVRSVINLARDMNMNVVAEGVELSEHWDMLKVLDCQDGQGFYFSRPMGLDKIMELPEQGEE